MASLRKQKASAIITIRDADKMTPRGRRAVAAWMVRQAGFLTKFGRELSPRFTARFLYR